MTKSLIEILPKIIEQGKKEAQKILDGISSSTKITLQTNELVLPTKTTDVKSSWGQDVKEIHDQKWFNRLIHGDNIFVLQALLSGDSQTPSLRGKINLIYIDPPFDSKADYRRKIKLPTVNVELEQKPAVIEQFAYSDTWEYGTISYLQMIVPRLILMKELLSDTGVICVHLDWHVAHYVKVMMDEIFEKSNFRNEITWKRHVMVSSVEGGIQKYPQKADYILIYSRSSKPYFKLPYKPVSKEKLKERFNKYEKETGRFFETQPLILKGNEPSFLKFPNKELKLPKGKRFAWNQSTLDNNLKNNPYIIYWTNTDTPRYKKYMDEFPGDPVSNIWEDINPITSTSNELVNYDTQKPKALLKRIIDSSCPEDGTVADFFAGSGTTGLVAEELGRKWIIADLGKPACLISRKRLIDQNAKPFLFQSIGDYQKEQFESSKYKRVGDLAQVIINLYGALPCPKQNGLTNNLGYIKESKTLIYVDSTSKMTGYNTLKKAQELRNSFMGGWKKVVVLGWNFDSDIGQIINGINDDKLEVLVIPPDLLDKIKSKGSYEKLVGQVKFSSLQYLTIEPIKKGNYYESDKDEITVELENYILLSPDALPLDDKNKEKLNEVIEKDPLCLIAYWSIDPDYDGKVFRSKWQDYREDRPDFRITRKTILIVTKKEGIRRVCVKAVDVFGFESATVVEVK